MGKTENERIQLIQMFDKDSGQSDEARADDIGLGLIICKKIVESSGG